MREIKPAITVDRILQSIVIRVNGYEVARVWVDGDWSLSDIRVEKA